MKKSNIVVALVTALITAGLCFALPRIIGMLVKPAVEARTESSQAVEEVKEPEPVVAEPELAAVEEEEKDLYQAFLDGEVSATRITEDGGEYTFKYSDLPHDPEDWECYTVSDERVDLDNDGEQELILNGPYGGMYIDVRDDKVYVLAEGEGTAGELSYTEYLDSVYIVHQDTSHGGRQMYWLTKYNGKGEVEDSFTLSAEYYDNEYDLYDEDSTFTFRDEPITMHEYEDYAKEILGVPNKIEWAEKVAEYEIENPATDSEKVANDGSEAFLELIGEFAGEYTYVTSKENVGGTLSIRLNELGYDINDNNSYGYRFLANDSNVEYIQGNRMMIAYPVTVSSEGEAVFKHYVIANHNGFLSVFEANKDYEKLGYLYTAWIKY